MNTRRLMAALLFALLCSALLTWQLSRHLQHAPPVAHALPFRQIVVASKDLQAGDPLTASSLRVVNWTTSQPLVGFFSRPQELTGRTLLLPIPSGEPILTHDLAGSQSSNALATSIPVGMRAVSLRAADETENVSGFLTPGSRVDILVTYHSNNGAAFVSSLVLQNICVLAIGNKERSGAEAKLRSDDSLTLLLTPEAAARLTAARSLGKVTFALRGEADKMISSGPVHVSLPSADADPQRATSLQASSQGTLPSKRTPPAAFTVETLTGGKSTIRTFQGSQP